MPTKTDDEINKKTQETMNNSIKGLVEYNRPDIVTQEMIGFVETLRSGDVTNMSNISEETIIQFVKDNVKPSEKYAVHTDAYVNYLTKHLLEVKKCVEEKVNNKIAELRPMVDFVTDAVILKHGKDYFLELKDAMKAEFIDYAETGKGSFNIAQLALSQDKTWKDDKYSDIKKAEASIAQEDKKLVNFIKTNDEPKIHEWMAERAYAIARYPGSKILEKTLANPQVMECLNKQVQKPTLEEANKQVQKLILENVIRAKVENGEEVSTLRYRKGGSHVIQKEKLTNNPSDKQKEDIIRRAIRYADKYPAYQKQLLDEKLIREAIRYKVKKGIEVRTLDITGKKDTMEGFKPGKDSDQTKEKIIRKAERFVEKHKEGEQVKKEILKEINDPINLTMKQELLTRLQNKPKIIEEPVIKQKLNTLRAKIANLIKTQPTNNKKSSVIKQTKRSRA
jgi:hypothetical protein